MTALKWMATAALALGAACLTAASAQEPGPGDPERRIRRRAAREEQVPADRPLHQRGERIFDALDANSDGTIDKEELLDKLPQMMERLRGAVGSARPAMAQPPRIADRPAEGELEVAVPAPGPAAVQPLPPPQEIERRVTELIERRVKEILERHVRDVIRDTVREAVRHELAARLEPMPAGPAGPPPCQEAAPPCGREDCPGPMRGPIGDAGPGGMQWGRQGPPAPSGAMPPCGREDRPGPMRGPMGDAGLGGMQWGQQGPPTAGELCPCCGQRECRMAGVGLGGPGPRRRSAGRGPGVGFGPPGQMDGLPGADRGPLGPGGRFAAAGPFSGRGLRAGRGPEGWGRWGAKGVGRQPRQGGGQGLQLFRRLDADRDGKLQTVELERAIDLLERVVQESGGRDLDPSDLARIAGKLWNRPAQAPPEQGPGVRGPGVGGGGPGCGGPSRQQGPRALKAPSLRARPRHEPGPPPPPPPAE